MIIPRIKQDCDAVATHYDSLDSIYRLLWGEHLHHGLWLTGEETQQEAVLQLVDLLANRLHVEAGWEMCDVGCGYGAAAQLLADDWSAIVTGLTVSESQYRFALSKQKRTSNPRYLCRDWLNNCLPSSHFNAVYAIESSEHMVDKMKFCSECYRVLQPKGRLAIFSWLAKEKPNACEIRYLLEPICTESRLPGMVSLKEYQLILKDVGFKDIQFEELTNNVKKTWSICILRSVKAFFFYPEFRKYVLSNASTERCFWKTIFRIKMAYELGSLKYGLFTATK